MFNPHLISVLFRQEKNWWLLDREAYSDEDLDLVAKSFQFNYDYTFSPRRLISFGNELIN